MTESSISAESELRDLRGVETAYVLKGDRLAATLTRVGVGIEFRYLVEYLADPGPPVATTLGLTAEPVITIAGAVPPFFAGLLPEGRRLTALREAVKTSLDDELSLVLAIGADAIGDVRVVPANLAPAIPAPTVKWHEGADIDFRKVLERNGIVERRGMSGLQDKASAAMITLPASSSGRDSILKLTPPEYPFLVENEAWFLGLARQVGFSVPQFQVITDRVGARGLLIERFDRTYENDVLIRHPAEDATQVLGIYPADKYLVTAEQMSIALISHCQSKKVAARDIFRLFLFAWLTGNGDLHAKNASIINVEGEWRIAPIYDVPSTLPFGDHNMALSLGGRDHDLSRKSFLQFADTIELPVAAATRAIDEMLIATEPVVQLFESRVEPFTHPRNTEALSQIEYRRRLLLAN